MDINRCRDGHVAVASAEQKMDAIVRTIDSYVTTEDRQGNHGGLHYSPPLGIDYCRTVRDCYLRALKRYPDGFTPDLYASEKPLAAAGRLNQENGQYQRRFFFEEEGAAGDCSLGLNSSPGAPGLPFPRPEPPEANVGVTLRVRITGAIYAAALTNRRLEESCSIMWCPQVDTSRPPLADVPIFNGFLTTSV